jgi:hopanoid-associated phosphorylase
VGHVTNDPTLLIVVGMRREARMAGGAGRVMIAGRGLAEALAERPAAVISFGLCGALEPSLQAGDLVVGSGVNGAPADAAWADRLMAALPDARRGGIASSGAMATSAAAKAALHARTGAIAVDMESHLVADAGVPFAILRAVSDPAHRPLPRAAQAGFKADGDADIAAVLRALIARPWELPALLRTAREAGAAFRALRDALDLLGPGVGCPYLGEHRIHMA